MIFFLKAVLLGGLSFVTVFEDDHNEKHVYGMSE